MATEPKVVWNLEAELGEGPVWVERDQALWFVDIKKQQVHRYDPASGSKESWDAPEQVGFIVPAERGGFVAGLQSGLFHFDETSGGFERIVEVEPDRPDNRLNDGVVDPKGRLWFGTMDNGEKAKTGAFYCFADGEVTRTRNRRNRDHERSGRLARRAECSISSTRSKARSRRRTSATMARSASRRPFVKDRSQRRPSRRADDRQQRVSLDFAVRRLGGAAVISPVGELVEQVRFPVANITKIAFGGTDLRTAYATTARQLLSPMTSPSSRRSETCSSSESTCLECHAPSSVTDPFRPAACVECRRRPDDRPSIRRPRGYPTRQADRVERHGLTW